MQAKQMINHPPSNYTQRKQMNIVRATYINHVEYDCRSILQLEQIHIFIGACKQKIVRLISGFRANWSPHLLILSDHEVCLIAAVIWHMRQIHRPC